MQTKSIYKLAWELQEFVIFDGVLDEARLRLGATEYKFL